MASALPACGDEDNAWTVAQAEAIDGLALGHPVTRIATQLVAGDAVQPAAGFGVGQAPKPPAMLERLRERLRSQVARRLDVERPAREERQQLSRVRSVEVGER